MDTPVSMTQPSFRAEFHSAMAAIDAAQWDAMVDADQPHLSHAFLDLAETSGSVSEDTGWLPCHLTIHQGDKMLAAMPLYQKSHSWGEFIFDWSWADAFQRHGLTYYPKLISATPFTPATANKLLVAQGEDITLWKRTLLATAIDFAQQHEFSSLHLQFLSDADQRACDETTGLLRRSDCQFHWHNDGYPDFDAFLAQFASKKRKNVKRERRRIRENGIRHRIVSGADISDAERARAYALCSRTFLLRGHTPYLNESFFAGLCDQMPAQILFVLAEHEDEIVAAAILLRGTETLYGRYWGSDGDFHSLHFETCYYQGIDYCIDHGLRRFEPGTQGEHKVARGFLPAETVSAHWLARADFAAAIEDYLDREQRGVSAYMAEIDRRSPFKAIKSGEP